MDQELAQRRCVPCSGKTPRLRGAELREYHEQLGHHWEVADEHHLVRTFHFPDFRGALAFTNRVGDLAEQENHHPDVLLTYGKVTVTLFTHKIAGLSENDFILAAKIDHLQDDRA